MFTCPKNEFIFTQKCQQQFSTELWRTLFMSYLVFMYCIIQKSLISQSWPFFHKKKSKILSKLYRSNQPKFRSKENCLPPEAGILYGDRQFRGLFHIQAIIYNNRWKPSYLQFHFCLGFIYALCPCPCPRDNNSPLSCILNIIIFNIGRFYISSKTNSIHITLTFS